MRDDRERVCTLFLPVFDPTLSRQSRLAIAGELEDALNANAESLELASFRYHSAPLPPERLADALDLAREAGTRRLSGFLRRLQRRQEYIAEVAQAWAHIPESDFPADPGAEAIRSLAIQSGAFERLVNSRAIGYQAGSILGQERHRQAIEMIPGRKDWLSKWTQPFRLRDVSRAHSQEALDALHTKVEQWKQAILDWSREHPAGAKSAAYKLVEMQLANGHPRFAAMTLCDLAARFKVLGNHPMQLAMSRLAVQTHPHDAQCHCQLGDALKRNHRLDDALQTYDETAAEFDDDVVARNGKAEVLRALHRLPEALACYEETIQRYDAVVARNGKAEVLRDLKRLPEALACYEDALLRHDDVVGRNGKAEVLRDLNRLPEALACYEETIQLFDNGVARCGKAEVLRDLNRFPEALACYEDAIQRHDDPVARHGKAEVLRDLGRLPEALACYEETLLQHEDVFARCGKADVLRDLNRLNEALACYEETLQRHDSIVARCGKAVVLRDLNRLPEALACYEETLQRHESVIARNGKAEVLRDLNRLPEALACYEETMRRHDSVITRNRKASLLAMLGRDDEALAMLPAEGGGLQDWVALHVRGKILLKKGRLVEAKAIFDKGCQAQLTEKHAAFYRIGRALCHLRQKEAAKALGLLPEVSTGRMGKLVQLLKAHALGEEHQIEACRSIVLPVITAGEMRCRNVAQELLLRYVEGTPAHSEEWLAGEELELALAE